MADINNLKKGGWGRSFRSTENIIQNMNFAPSFERYIIYIDLLLSYLILDRQFCEEKKNKKTMAHRKVQEYF